MDAHGGPVNQLMYPLGLAGSEVCFATQHCEVFECLKEFNTGLQGASAQNSVEGCATGAC